MPAPRKPAATPLERRQRADRDVTAIIDHYLEESAEVALEFVDAFEAACDFIARNPGLGSPRYAHELNLPGLRHWHCGNFPYLVFYMEHLTRIDIWRVLHAQRDIPRWMREDTPPPG